MVNGIATDIEEAAATCEETRVIAIFRAVEDVVDLQHSSNWNNCFRVKRQAQAQAYTEEVR